jgi:hypothetical protein
LLRHCLREQFQLAQAAPDPLMKLPELIERLLLQAA